MQSIYRSCKQTLLTIMVKFYTLAAWTILIDLIIAFPAELYFLIDPSQTYKSFGVCLQGEPKDECLILSFVSSLFHGRVLFTLILMLATLLSKNKTMLKPLVFCLSLWCWFMALHFAFMLPSRLLFYSNSNVITMAALCLFGTWYASLLVWDSLSKHYLNDE